MGLPARIEQIEPTIHPFVDRARKTRMISGVVDGIDLLRYSVHRAGNTAHLMVNSQQGTQPILSVSTEKAMAEAGFDIEEFCNRLNDCLDHVKAELFDTLHERVFDKKG